MTREQKLAWLAWATICVVWGTTYLRSAAPRPCLSSWWLARWMAAGVVLALVAMATGRRMPPPRTWASLALLGFLMNVVGNGFVVWAEQYVASGLTAVVVASVPVWSVSIEARLPGGERLRWPTVVGLIVGFVGIVILVFPKISMGSTEGRAVLGGVIALQVACLGWALGTSARAPFSVRRCDDRLAAR
jgi:drug/metabolite transporter (DMT)-like permease